MQLLPSTLVGFVTGCLVLQWQPTLPVAVTWLAGGSALGITAIAVGKGGGRCRAWVARLLVLLAATCLGFGYASWRAEARLAEALPPALEGVDLVLVGVVDDLPATSAQGTRFAFATEAVRAPAGAVVPGRLSLAWYADRRGDAPPIVRAGERWTLTVRLKRPHGNVNPHGFDLEAWLLQNGLRATGYVRSQGENRRLDAFAGRLADHVQRTREAVRDRIRGALGAAPYAGVIVALAIGEQRAIPEAQWRVFNRTGTTHLISISGLHVTVFATLAAALAHSLARRSVRLTLRVPARRIAVLAGSLAAWGYVLLAGAQVPAQRTLVMLAVAAVGLWLARPGTARMVWLWALAVVLAFDPWAGLTPGFWLSFGAVGLLLYTGTGRLALPPATRRDAVARGIATAARAQFVVTVGLVPLTLAVFGQVSLAAPLANAVAIPVVTFGVVPVALAAIALPIDAPWQLAHGLFAALMVVLEWLAALPGAVWQQHAPAPWAVGAALAGVGWLLAPPGVPLRGFGAFWLLPLFLVRPLPPAPGTYEITVLDVGQGLAAVVRTHAHVLLYDTGPRFNDEADAGGRIVAPFLRATGIRSVSRLVVSHLDSDHSGGARSLLQTVPVASVLSSVPEGEALWNGMDVEVARCHAGQQWTWDGVAFTVLHPSPDAYASPRPRPNDMSCVLRIAAAGGSVLLTGDIEARSEAALLHAGAPLAVDVLVVPHHGSRTSSTPAFVAATAPRVAIFTPGYRNRFGHPRPEVVERYRASGAALARTDLEGAITLRFDGRPVVAFQGARAATRRYWHDLPAALDGDATDPGAGPAKGG